MSIWYCKHTGPSSAGPGVPSPWGWLWGSCSYL